MKKKDLERKLKDLGFTPPEGKDSGPHTTWTGRDGFTVQVPRHRELAEGTARTILKEAEKHT